MNGLFNAGFNGIRLPMWPEDSDENQIKGPNPANESIEIGRSFCDQLNKDWVKRIKTAVDSDYKDFVIYFSPGLDNRAL